MAAGLGGEAELGFLGAAGRANGRQEGVRGRVGRGLRLEGSSIDMRTATASTATMKTLRSSNTATPELAYTYDSIKVNLITTSLSNTTSITSPFVPFSSHHFRRRSPSCHSVSRPPLTRLWFA